MKLVIMGLCLECVIQTAAWFFLYIFLSLNSLRLIIYVTNCVSGTAAKILFRTFYDLLYLVVEAICIITVSVLTAEEYLDIHETEEYEVWWYHIILQSSPNVIVTSYRLLSLSVFHERKTLFRRINITVVVITII